jgi:hypothetical protein
VRTPHLARGYLGGDPDGRFRDEAEGGARRYRTGDLGRHRADGAVVFAGRADRQVKIRGHRVEPAEVEAALEDLPGVAAAAVVAREDAGGERRLVAYLAGAGAGLGLAGVRRALQPLLPEAWLPAAVVAVDRLPLTPNGKLDERALPEPAAEPGPAPAAPPHDDLERRIAGVWARVLRLPGVGVDQNFFDLGGNSMAMVEVHVRLERELNRDLSLVDLFRHPDVRSLSQHLRGGDHDDHVLAEVRRRIAARSRGRARRQPVHPDRRA